MAPKMVKSNFNKADSQKVDTTNNKEKENMVE